MEVESETWGRKREEEEYGGFGKIMEEGDRRSQGLKCIHMQLSLS